MENLKTKNNQNCHKIELWKSDNQGVKEETFIQPGRWGREDSWQGGNWRMGWLHICVQITRKNNLGARQIVQTRSVGWGNKASKPLVVKAQEGCCGGRNSQSHRRVHWINQQPPTTHTKPPQ